jgi:hypothetical protein
MAESKSWQSIPTNLTQEQFEEFVLPHLKRGTRGPQPKSSLHAIFNCILKLLYLGCRWKELPIDQDKVSFNTLFGLLRTLGDLGFCVKNLALNE